jgi:alcohol dehydrogenase (NADP+)
MPTANAYVATSPTAPLTRSTIERREAGPHDVLIDIEYCGICHSDIHTARSDWRPAPYPITPGHEIVGTVAEVGSAVIRHAVGDRVGVGCLVDSCRECEPCRRGDEQYCAAGNVQTYGSIGADGRVTQGGYSTRIVVTEDFVLRIPGSLAPAAAAPLLCAGITVYSPLRHWGAGPGTRVAVVGLGGLGHMAVQLAHAMGSDVTVLSQSLKKREDGLRLGASSYHATSAPDTFSSLAGSFDLIVNTVSAQVDINAYLSLLAIDGTLVNVGVPIGPLSVSVFHLVRGRRSLAGSVIGGMAQHQEMLDFCAEQGLAAEVEVISADQINEAYERVLASDVRYRFVIDNSTLS